MVEQIELSRREWTICTKFSPNAPESTHQTKDDESIFNFGRPFFDFCKMPFITWTDKPVRERPRDKWPRKHYEWIIYWLGAISEYSWSTHLMELRIAISRMMRSLYFIGEPHILFENMDVHVVCVDSRRKRRHRPCFLNELHKQNDLHTGEWRWNKDDEVHVTADWSARLFTSSHICSYFSSSRASAHSNKHKHTYTCAHTQNNAQPLIQWHFP